MLTMSPLSLTIHPCKSWRIIYQHFRAQRDSFFQPNYILESRPFFLCDSVLPHYSPIFYWGDATVAIYIKEPPEREMQFDFFACSARNFLRLIKKSARIYAKSRDGDEKNSNQRGLKLYIYCVLFQRFLIRIGVGVFVTLLLPLGALIYAFFSHRAEGAKTKAGVPNALECDGCACTSLRVQRGARAYKKCTPFHFLRPVHCKHIDAVCYLENLHLQFSRWSLTHSGCGWQN